MCKKSLLMMLLLALLVPWAANAQTSLWSEDFEGGTMPAGWTTDGPGSWSVGVGDYSTGTGAGHGSYNAKITHGTTGNVTKLITPEIDLSTVASAELSFMHIQRSWSGDIDQLRVYYRTSSSGSWTQIAEYTAAFASWTTEDGIVLPDLSSTYQIAFEYTDKYGYGVGVDNIVIVQGASCPKPAGLAATSNVQSATLTWTSDASSFHVAYSADGTANPDDLTYTTVTTNSYTKDNLAIDADHYFWVRANCSGTDQSDWAGPVSVHIGYCVPAPISVDNNGISNVTFGIDDYVVNNETPKATYADYSNLVGAVRAGVEATIAITFKTGYTYNTYVWVDLDNSLSFDADEVVCYGESTSSNPTTLTLNFTIPADQTPGDFRLRIGSADSGLGSDPTAANPCYTGSYGCFQDYTLRVLEAPSCLPPTGLAASDVTAHTANISWTSDGNAWLIGYSNDNFATEQYVEVTENPYTLTGLAPETAYQVRVQTKCSEELYSVFTNSVSFTTTVACPAPTGLATSNLTGHGATITWTAEEGALYQSALVKTAEYDANNITWSESFEGNSQTWNNLDPETGYTFALRKDCGSEDGYSTVVTRTFTTTVACVAPSGLAATLTPGDGTVATLTWTENGTATEWDIEYGTDAEFESYTTVNASGTPSKELTGLTPETTYYARVKTYCGGEDGYSTYSNVVSFIPTNAYFLTVNDGTSTNGLVPIYGTWVDNITKSQFIIPAENLADMAWGTINKMTFYAAADKNWGAAQFEVYMTETNETTLSSLADYSTMTKVKNAGSLSISGNQMVVEFDTPYSYMGGNLMIGFLQTVSGSWSGCSWYGVSAEGASMGGYGSSINQQNFLPKTTFNYEPGEEPSCYKPTGLAVNYTGGTEAIVSWTSDATAWNMRVNGVDVNGVITNPYTLTGLEYATTYQVEVQANCGDNGTSEWAGPVSFTTDLCAPENMCELTITLTDAYGDGGGNIQVVDVLTNEVLRSFTNSGESTTYTLAVCDGRELNFVYASTDSWSYENGWVITDINNEIISEHVGCSSSGSCDAPTNGVIANYTVNCTVTTCHRPTNLAASEIGNRSAVLSWTENGEATEWVVEITDVLGGQITEWNASANPYTIVGLEPETDYSVRVRPVCSDFDDKWSTAITFTTDVPCPAPLNLEATHVTATSALISWLGFGENYDLRYMAATDSKGVSTSNNAKAHRSYTYNPNDKHAQMPFVANRDAQSNTNINTKGSNLRDGWYYYDNGTSAYPGYGGIGTGSVMDVYWAVMFPAGMFNETTLTKIAVYEEPSYNDNPITLYVYAGGITAPNEGELLYTEEFTTTPNNDFEEFTLSNPVTINPLQNLWIVLKENGAYPACGSTNTGDPNGRWISLDGENWQDVVDAGVEITWMIRAYLEGEAVLPWIDVTGINASEYQLTDLDAETLYTVQVRANCGDDGQGEWATIQFTTGSFCDAPTDLEATDITYNAATLNWAGSQESYNLRYRHATEVDPTAPAIIILEAHDTWGDGTGYQMLLDADATAYGVEIPESGPYTGSDYSAFEYLIPENADCDSNTENLVLDGSITLEIPAGVYDWCIVNPEPGGNMWIAGNGDIPGRYDDYVFEAGVTYHFTMQRFGTGDGAALEITRPLTNWTEVTVNEVPYTLTGLNPEAYYEWQVQGINPSCTETEGLTEWSEIATFTTEEAPEPQGQTIEFVAGWNWISVSVEVEDPIEMLKLLEDVLGENADLIKNQSINTEYDSEWGWFGDLDEVGVTNEEMLMVLVTTPCEVMLQGTPVEPEMHSITIKPGWNWIGYPVSEEMTLDDAFANFEAEAGDLIKNRSVATEYDPDWGWFGDLETLVPGGGYMYYSASSETKTLIFATPAKGAKSGK